MHMGTHMPWPEVRHSPPAILRAINDFQKLNPAFRVFSYAPEHGSIDRGRHNIVVIHVHWRNVRYEDCLFSDAEYEFALYRLRMLVQWNTSRL